MTAKISEILTAGRALVADPATWTTGWVARNKKGDPVNIGDPDACRYCAFGAALKAARDLGDLSPDIDALAGPLDVAAARIKPEILDRTGATFRPIVVLNDCYKDRENVVRAYDMAIALQRDAEADRAFYEATQGRKIGETRT